jgi:ADP-L-glycero-D-manno-heptose 6-epimerase
MRSVVHQAFQQIEQTGKMNLFKSYRPEFKDGEQLRDFVYVKDVVRGMIALMTTDHAGECGLYNLGTGKARSFFDLAKATFSALGKKEDIEFIDMPESLRGQYQYYTQANMDKFNHAIKDFNFMGLEDAVDDYVNSHLSEKSPYLNSRKE